MSVRAFENGKEFMNKFREYVDYCNKKNRLTNVAGFCVFADITRETFYAQEDYYSDTFKKINQIIEDEALNCKSLGDARVIFYMKNKCGFKDKQEVETTNTQRINIVNDLGINDDTDN